jgi:DNA-binding NtrC family response regulator
MTERILAVNDEEVVRDIISSMLTSAGYECQAVQSGFDALACLAAGERFELLITDLLNWPMDGLTLLERTKENFPDIPVVILTAIDDASVAIACARSGADEFIQLPVKRERLLSAVSRALAHRRAKNGK